MKDHIQPFVYEYLNDLSQNNNREWFMANKDRYEVARADFLEFVEALIPEIYKIDPSIGMQKAQNCMYRIYRDLRFSPDKTPYKTHFAVYIATGGVKQHGRPGYYLHIQNGESAFGGGIFMPSPELLDAIRKEIYYNIDTFKGIIGSKEYKKYFPSILWKIEMLKKGPKGFDPAFPDIDLLKYKHYVSEASIANDTATSEGFLRHVAELARVTHPLNQFIQDVMFDLSQQ